MHPISVTWKVNVFLVLCVLTSSLELVAASIALHLCIEIFGLQQKNEVQDSCVAKLTRGQQYAGVASPVMTASAK